MRTPRVGLISDDVGDVPSKPIQIPRVTTSTRIQADDQTPCFPALTTHMEPEQVDSLVDDMKSTALDGFLLLDSCRVEFPEDATRADVNGMNIRRIVSDDMVFFSNLLFLDMSDNHAPFEPLGALPALKELDFQCNALSKIQNVTGFESLEWLNLSFNCLTNVDLEELVKIPKLREVYLSSNQVSSLPPIMDRFSRLETLSLERNNIHGTGIFALLAVAPRLKNLNLSYNKLTEFPESALMSSEKGGGGFLSLSYLNLAHNKITRERDVFPLVKLRMLQQLVLYGNPLTHAAVQTQDKTKLIYNPVPNMTDVDVETERDIELNIVVAYPETKKKKSSYKNVQIARVTQAALPTSIEFKARGQRSMHPGNESNANLTFPPIEKKIEDTTTDTSNAGPDATFLTGVGIVSSSSSQSLVSRQDKFPHIRDQRHTESELPSYFLTRSLAPTTEIQQNKLKTAMNSLRYQLHHPLTSHNDIDVASDIHANRPTALHKIRQRPRRQDGPETYSTGVLASIDRAIDQVNEKLHQRDVARNGVNINKLLAKANRLMQQK